MRPVDHVVLTFRHCGGCAYCHRSIAVNQFGSRDNRSPRVIAAATQVRGEFFGQSSFAGYALTTPDNTVVADPATDPVITAPLGCGFQTGAGAVLNALRPAPERPDRRTCPHLVVHFDRIVGVERISFDVDAYVQRVRSSPCFVCAIVAGEHDSDLEQVIAEDEENFAFLSRYPTLFGSVLVAPKRHLEHVVRDLPEDAFLRIMSLVHRVTRAVEAVVPTERTYLLSLGSHQGNSHLHWHIAPLPPGVPYREQQFHALMAENGVLPWTHAQAVELAEQLRAAMATPS
ncbi:HIT domain-containing protein [Nocardia bhagyanarayanae]|uniref:HIT domain-containing protein n=1 Tax=Nocardia bhagyanarayanae TaxID=1215925 RepID=A0A543FHE2_9NOCA|nr:HIT domain-containing protein [Nocardia bhagyanarayanae]TQM33182.1 HIT domain-containing protein [Nocardia bhagyanarayanae]